MEEIAFVLFDYGLKGALSVYFVFAVVMLFDELFFGFDALVVEMFPDGFSGDSAVDDVLGGSSFEDWSFSELLLLVGRIV